MASILLILIDLWPKMKLMYSFHKYDNVFYVADLVEKDWMHNVTS